MFTCGLKLWGYNVLLKSFVLVPTVLGELQKDGGCAPAERLSGRKAHCLPGTVEVGEENKKPVILLSQKSYVLSDPPRSLLDRIQFKMCVCP